MITLGKKILFVGNKDSFFTYEFIKYVLLGEFAIDIANTGHINLTENRFDNFYNCNDIRIKECGTASYKKFHRTRLMLSMLKSFYNHTRMKSYDIVNIHYLELLEYPYSKLPKNQLLVVTIYGSDILRATSFELSVKKKIFKRANAITIETEYLKNKFIEIYGNEFDKKIVKVGLGSSYIDLMEKTLILLDKNKCKQENGLPVDKKIIFIGYNGSEAQQHLKVLKCIKDLSQEYKKKIFIVCHCSYGLDPEYENKIRKELSESGIDGRLDKRYLMSEELVKFRFCCDIFLNMQTTDVLSSSMLEFMYCGSTIIQGNWLIYEELKNSHVYIIKRIDDLAKKLQYVLNSKENSNDKAFDKKLAYDLMSWKNKRKEWLELLKPY